MKRILLRTNLTILDEAYCEGFPELFAEIKVEIVASMPCYMAENVDACKYMGALIIGAVQDVAKEKIFVTHGLNILKQCL